MTCTAGQASPPAQLKSKFATEPPEVASLFPGRAVRLDWRVPDLPAVAAPHSRRIAFPGPALARKGAYEVRDAARAMDLEVLLLGADLEDPSFWRGVRTCRPDPGAAPGAWLEGVAAVVQPALVEEQPRSLLTAHAAGVPVIATAACGLDGAGVAVIAPLDTAGLVDQLQRVMRMAEVPAPSGTLLSA